MTLFAEDSHVKISPMQEPPTVSETGLTETGLAFGSNMPELSQKSGLAMPSSKMSNLSAGMDLTEFSGALPPSGTMQNGKLFPAPLLASPKLARGYGLLPTLPASEWRDCSKASVLARLDRGGRVARRICSTSPLLRSEETIVFLNPFFAEWMTGLPIGWTELKPAATP